MGWVAMTLPDATRSDRIYPLLQNLDLENLAFATLQGTGETLNIEEMNEDELRRLVLVNLARLSVKGEWNGLLTASTSSVGNMLAVAPPSASFDYDLSGQSQGSQASNVTFTEDTLYMMPFTVPAQISASDIKFGIPSGTFNGTFYVAIYACDSSTNLPAVKVDSASASISSTGDKSISFASGATLAANTLYYVSISWARTSGSCTYAGGYYEYGRSGLPISAASAISTNSGGCLTYAAAGTPPTPLTTGSIGVLVGAGPKIRMDV